MIRESDTLCRNFLRINRRTFGALLEMVRDVGGLNETRNVCLEEIVAGFLYTLAHHKKNRMIGALFYRSGETVSRQFHACLMAILKLHVVLLKKPTPILEDSIDDRWKHFKNCLGALDGTMISVNVPSEDRCKYRTRKGNVAMNVLEVCSPVMEFIYVLPGWEGSAHDGRILRDAISRPNGFKVPKGCYYLCDGGYTNGEGFLAPYRGHLYHLREWNNGPRQPQSAEEYFNLRHASARNKYMPPGSFDDDGMFEEVGSDDDESDEDLDEDEEYITSIDVSDPWTNFRNTLAQNMFNNWRARNH
ncbi:hypothetical protein M5689_003083 [Euphorbia peplus]|nr:hypothetical protein M5689_003083 [Euphorbia peplus]